MARCAEPDCLAVVHDHYWARVRAGSAGWYFGKDGTCWCPDHVPDWVETWRARKREAG